MIRHPYWAALACVVLGGSLLPLDQQWRYNGSLTAYVVWTVTWVLIFSGPGLVIYALITRSRRKRHHEPACQDCRKRKSVFDNGGHMRKEIVAGIGSIAPAAGLSACGYLPFFSYEAQEPGVNNGTFLNLPQSLGNVVSEGILFVVVNPNIKNPNSTLCELATTGCKTS